MILITHLPVDCTEAVPVEFDLTQVMPNFFVVSVAQEEFLPQTPTTSVQGEVISWASKINNDLIQDVVVQ